ncbi:MULTISPECIES: hypothetical protein [Sinorhizobium]|uniref:hypothetical protein n=1 Tax=Sinorhizobium TaxID=28105 RepID=UPI0001E4EB2E|nr:MULTISPECIES: hypothetical protein [Sinorhizobium]AEG09289.1 hypothetical protein SinmeB_5033 [Sinorhizobium meliloti BL225C]MDE4548773.1 hypothetical protein [Sinorhizobium meliloti]MDE4570571.1 hypothetical protein [Sinorhizobium meliloti]MQU78046.1 hypothetical protein [Sinorhizobium medicae]RVM26267.1 hypothetical protein CN132_16535 [Sinorhizobium meliloti]
MSDEIDNGNETENEIKFDISEFPEIKRKKGRRKRTVTEKERERWQSPEWNDHLKKIGRQKGDPKVPGSGRRPTPKEAKELANSKSVEVVEFMLSVMRDEDASMKDRMKAAAYLGDMTLSKAPTESKVEVNHTHQIVDMMARINAQRHGIKDITPATPVIEANFVPLEIEDEGEV